MHIYCMWPWKVPKWPWFWAEVAVKAWRDMATLWKTKENTVAKKTFFGTNVIHIIVMTFRVKGV
jgi:hypothetical protein